MDLLFLGVKQTLESWFYMHVCTFAGVLWAVPSHAEPTRPIVVAPLQTSERSDVTSAVRTLHFITEPGSEIQESPLSPRDIEQDHVVLM